MLSGGSACEWSVPGPRAVQARDPSRKELRSSHTAKTLYGVAGSETMEVWTRSSRATP